MKARRQAGQALRDVVGKVDLDTAKGDDLDEPLRAMFKYLLARMGSEGD